MNLHGSLKRLAAGRPCLCLSDRRYRLRQYFVLYTALFALMCCLVFRWYIFAGRTFINQGDGWSQHYRAYVYFAKYMRSIVRGLLHSRRLVFPEWGFAFGEGNGILHTLSYYVMFDPFAVPSVFVPTRFMWVYYGFMILMRLYLAGAAFSWLCFYTLKGIGRHAVMAGAMSYIFCFWAVLNVCRHPYFLNPLLYYPLVILGVEKVLRREGPWILVVSVFVAEISNFYYFYNIALMTVLYTAVRLVTMYGRDLKPMLGALGRIAGGAVLGAAMGGFYLLPVVYSFMGDTRMLIGVTWHFVYPLKYYSRLLYTFFADDKPYWLCMGFAAPVALAIFLLFMRKGRRNGLLKALFVTCAAIILCPALGQLLNGMSYMSNKWCWAFALLCAYIFSAMWQDLMNLGAKEAVGLAVALAVCFFGMIFLEYSRTMSAFAGIGFAFMFLLVVFPLGTQGLHDKARGMRRRQSLAFLLTLASIVNVSFFKNVIATGDGFNARNGKEIRDVVNRFFLTEAEAVRKAAAKSKDAPYSYRYSGRALTNNAGATADMSSTNFYWTISNPAIGRFRKQMELGELPHSYRGYDDRTALITLSAVKYFVVPESDRAPVPYGFSYVGSFNVNGSLTAEAKGLLAREFGEGNLSEAQVKVVEDATAAKYKVWRNNNTLPLAYTYGSVIGEEMWNGLSAVQRQEAMLQAVMLEGWRGETDDGAAVLTSQSLDYDIKCNGNGVTLGESGFVVTQANATATISFEGLPDSETYFSVKGLDFDGVSTYELYFGDGKYDPLNLFSKTRWNLLPYASREAARKQRRYWTEPTGTNLTLRSSAGVTKTLTYRTENFEWYFGRHDFTVNLDYSKNAVKSVTVTFQRPGVYSFDSIEIICQPMDGYARQVKELKKTVLEGMKVGTDTISGSITLERPQVLCFSVPYSAGWTAYVDGEKAALYRANVRNMAVPLGAGRHDVRLVYHTPYLRQGALLSAAGFACFIVLLVLDIRRKRRAVGSGRG